MHGVADGEIRDPEKIAATVTPTRGDPGEEEAAVAAVATAPAVRNGEEGEREVCGGVGLREGSGGDGGAVGRLRGDETASEDAEERRRVEGVVAAEETVVCDDATEAGAGAGGAGEVRRRVEAEEDLAEGIVGEVRRGLEVARSWLRRWSHGELGFLVGTVGDSPVEAGFGCRIQRICTML